jgi:hypothetical protein
MVLSNTLSVYRNLLKLARSLPAATRDGSIAQIREGFKTGKGLSDPSEVQKMLEKANSTLGYLKIVTPKSAQNKVQEGKVTFVFGDKDPLRPDRAVSNWTGSNMDPDSVKRHNQSLKRAGFKSNSDMKGIF